MKTSSLKATKSKTKHYQELTNKVQLDLIAPIIVFLMADASEKSEDLARRAANQLIKLDCHLMRGISLHDILHNSQPPRGMHAEYNALVEGIVLNEKPEWTIFIDRYGARGFTNERGETEFIGDDCGMHALFRSADKLVGRVSTLGIDRLPRVQSSAASPAHV